MSVRVYTIRITVEPSEIPGVLFVDEGDQCAQSSIGESDTEALVSMFETLVSVLKTAEPDQQIQMLERWKQATWSIQGRENRDRSQ